MKYGKQYEDLLSQDKFEKWRQSSLRYKALKKVISRLTDELSSIGLDAAVLRELLEESNEIKQNLNVDRNDEETLGSDRAVRVNGDHLKARAEYQLEGTVDSPTPRIKLVFDSTSSESDSETDAQVLAHLNSKMRKSRLDGDSSTEVSSASLQLPSDASDSHRFEELGSDSGISGDEGAPLFALDNTGRAKHPLLQKLYGHGVVALEDVTPPGSPQSPFTQVSTPKSSPKTPMPNGHSFKDDDHFALPTPSLPLDAHTDVDGSLSLPIKKAPNISRLKIINDASSSEDPSTDEGDVADDEDGKTPRRSNGPLDGLLKPPSLKKKKKRRHRRVIYIPLKSDTEFYSLLAKALQSLQNLELEQKETFARQVQDLAAVVSRVATPAKSTVDMYCWREIFSLWVEAQIFESSRERDRGERSLEQAEERLHWFVDQVGRRKLASKMKAKDSKTALHQFLDLNVTLLDLKRFIRLNEEAARKILKKHDKRTALTGSANFPQFLQHLRIDNTDATNGVLASTSKPDLVLPDSLSLPHILLSTMTKTLLPIVPQIDDYTCAICGDISYKPIRLDCGHRFCLRCLVKMQHRKQDACPHCRAPVVLKADAHNLDNAFEAFLELYFPKEVKAKAKSNEKEVALEQFNMGEVLSQQMMSGNQRDRCVIA